MVKPVECPWNRRSNAATSGEMGMATPLTGLSASVFQDNRPGAGALQQELNSRLEPDERLLWSGFPRQGLMLRPQDAFLVPFSLLWGGFAFFWEYSVVTSTRAPIFFDLWGIPFVGIGLYMIIGRFFTDARIRANTIYAVTTQRVMIIAGLWNRSVRSLELLGLAEMNLAEDMGDRGTITFGPAAYANWSRGWPGAGRNLSPAFESIQGAPDVLKIIRDAQKAAARERSS
jgi:hypothetical protein